MNSLYSHLQEVVTVRLPSVTYNLSCCLTLSCRSAGYLNAILHNEGITVRAAAVLTHTVHGENDRLSQHDSQ